MNKLIAWLLLLSLGAVRAEELSAERHVSREQLKTLVPELLRQSVATVIGSSAGNSYFKNLDPNSIELDDKPVVPGVSGWVLRWSYSRDIKQVRNPNIGAAALLVPRAENKDGILIDLIVASGSGGEGIGFKKGYRITGTSIGDRLIVGYNLVAFEEDKGLEELLDKVCKDLQVRIAKMMGVELERFPEMQPRSVKK